MLSRRLAWGVALAATLTMTVSYIDRQMLAALGQTVRVELDFTKTEFGWLGSAFSIAYLVATPLAGWWIDRIGARRGLLISVLVWSGVAALHALAPGFGTLFMLRIALGVAEAPSFPGAAQTVQRALPPQDRARGFGVLFTGSSIGGLIAPILASTLFAIAGWQFAFLASAIVGLVWVPMWIALTWRRDVRKQLDVKPASEARSMSMFRLLGQQATIRTLLLIAASAPVVGFMLQWGPTYLADVHKVKQEDIGGYAWLPPVLFDLGAIGFGDLASRLRDRGGAVRVLFAFATVIAAVLVLLPFVDGGPWTATIIISIAMVGGGGMYTIATADIMARVPVDCISAASGLLAASQSLVLIIMHPLVGAALDAYGTYTLVTTVLAAWVFPGAIAWIVWRPPPISASRSAT